MPEGGSITGYLFADFDFENDANRIRPDQNGPFRLPSDAEGTLAVGAEPIDINVIDDDEEFDDGFQDDPGGTPLNQILRDDIVATDADGNTVFVAAGAVLEVEFTLTAIPEGGGDPIDLLFVAAGPGENQGDLTLVVSTAPLEPGTTYSLSFKNDGGGTPYGEIICFARGTLILTPSGQTPVEALRPGDLVMTLDRGVRPITWVARRALLFPGPEDQPIQVAAGAYGPGQPFADLQLSPQHCVLRADPVNRLLFDAAEVLVPARDCQDGARVRPDRAARMIEYVHFMVDGHDIVLANGLAVESFYPGPQARRALDGAAHAALLALHPELADPTAEPGFPPARRRMRPHETSVARSYIRPPEHAA